MSKKIFITGTDTEIGKTLVSTTLMSALRKMKHRVSGFKPIAAGCEYHHGVWGNEDALALQQAANVELSYQDVNPYALPIPSSPHIAAQAEGINIDVQALNRALLKHSASAEITIIEGAGGWRVPISEQGFLSDWVRQEKIPVIVVVGVRLGCLNHALLTYESIKKDGVKLLGWVANCVDPEFNDIDDNIAFLEQHLPIPLLGVIPYLRHEQPSSLEQYLDLALLTESLDLIP